MKTSTEAVNGAGSGTQRQSDGFLVDLTSPRMHSFTDGTVPGGDIQYSVCLVHC